MTSRDRNRFSLQRHWKPQNCLFNNPSRFHVDINLIWLLGRWVFALHSCHFTFIHVHMHSRYIFTPTFSSKSLICLLWISVLSSRSRILCKNREKMKRSVFVLPKRLTDAICRDYLVSLVQQFHPLLEDLAVVLATLPQHLPPQLLHGCA